MIASVKPRAANAPISTALNRSVTVTPATCACIVVTFDTAWSGSTMCTAARTAVANPAGSPPVFTTKSRGIAFSVCSYGRYHAGRSMRKLNRSSFTSLMTPTTVSQGKFSCPGLTRLMRLPMGSSPAHPCRANSSLMTTTGKPSALSCASSKRPLTSVTPRVCKYSGLTKRCAVIGTSLGLTGGWPSIVKTES